MAPLFILIRRRVRCMRELYFALAVMKKRAQLSAQVLKAFPYSRQRVTCLRADSDMQPTRILVNFVQCLASLTLAKPL